MLWKKKNICAAKPSFELSRRLRGLRQSGLRMVGGLWPEYRSCICALWAQICWQKKVVPTKTGQTALNLPSKCLDTPPANSALQNFEIEYYETGWWSMIGEARACVAGRIQGCSWGEEFLGTGSSLSSSYSGANHYIDHRLHISYGDATARFRRHLFGASYAAALPPQLRFPSTIRKQTTESRPWRPQTFVIVGFKFFFLAHTQSAPVLLWLLTNHTVLPFVHNSFTGQ